jgi:hypothetical protein
MFHTNFPRITKSAAILAALFVLPASASAQAYGVLANVQTAGFPGAYNNFSGEVPLGTEEVRFANPPGTYVGLAPNQVWAEAETWGRATQGELEVKTHTVADHLSAKGFPNGHPYASSEVKFWDTATVVSDSLPAGSPVTLVFRSELDVALTGDSFFAGTFYGSHTVAGRSVSLQQTFDATDMQYSSDLSKLTVQTQVGSRIQMKGRAYLNQRSYYFATFQPPVYDGALDGDLKLRLVLESATGGARVVGDSGVTYYPEQN